MDPDSNLHWFLGTLGDYSCFARVLYFPPPKTAICSETKTVLPKQLAPAVDHNSTVKVGCMLKRCGLIYPESPQAHLCTQLSQPNTHSSTDDTTHQEVGGDPALEATDPKCPEFSLQHPPNIRI